MSMFEFGRDLRFGLRLLAKSPVFTATAALLLAVGISANTLIFSALNALLLKPLPVSHPENLVRIVEVHPNQFITWDHPYDFCDDAAARDADFSDVICQGEGDVAFRDAASDARTVTERVRIHLVSPNFFSSLGVRADLGRVLNADDERTRAQNAVASYDFWRRRWSGDPSIVGRKIILAGHPFTIVGVTPEAFNGLAVDTSPDLRVPASLARALVTPAPHAGPTVTPVWAQIFGRLRNGVSFVRADAQIDPLLYEAFQQASMKMFGLTAAEGAQPNPSMRSHLRLQSVANGVSTLREQFSHSLELLMAGVALLLLMACANVAGLLLARATARNQEMGIRLALGASPGRIVRQLLTEGLLLALLGGFAGVVLTSACLPLLTRALPPIRDRGAVLQPLAVHISIDLRVLGFAIVATVLTAVLFGLSPALRSARADVTSALKGTRTATRRLATGNLIVIAQVAICTLILMGAALLIETLQRMRSMNPGFDADRVVTFTIDPQMRGYTRERAESFSKGLLERAQALGGVSDASIASRGLMRGTGVKATLGAAGKHMGPSDFLDASMNDVTPDYFQTMGMHLLAGRGFTWFDRSRAKPYPVIVNQAFARHFFPGQNPIGARFGFAGPGGVATADDQIIGVVSDAKYRSLREPIPPTAYSPGVDGFDSVFILHLRTRGNPEALVAPVRQLLRSLDPEMPIIETRTLRQEVDASLWQERLLAALSSIFGAIAALLAIVGLYGTLEYAVKSRTREIGVRAALGAQPARIVGLFSREACMLTAGGLILGLGAYATVSVYLRRVLYDVRPWESSAVVAVVILIALIAALATVPAVSRAARIDPATALRAE
jgi:predicted permease